MKLALSTHIKAIDKYCAEVLGISEIELIGRSGIAVADAVRELVPAGDKIIFFCGKGNNGADGYAAAIELLADYKVTVYDVFGEGQMGEGGKYYLNKYKNAGGELRSFELGSDFTAEMRSAAAVIDAVFGTGFHGELPAIARDLCVEISKLVGVSKIAIDVPIGINADNGSVDICTCTMTATVELCFVKPGIVSYPARSYAGRIIHNDIGLPMDKILSEFEFEYNYVNEELAIELLPKREENSNKGSFGRTLLITGSEKYKGAGALSLEAALRGGVGYVTFSGAPSLCDGLCQRFPEAIYMPRPDNDQLSDEDIKNMVLLSEGSNSTLVGSGSNCTSGLCRLVCALLEIEGGTLILDADAINALSLHAPDATRRIKNSKRRVILTPHPLEFSRISSNDVADVQLNRIASAKKFAAENKCILVLKGAGTVVTDGERVYINGSGSSALAKAGSGDVLAGYIAALTAFTDDPLHASALAVYLHGSAADTATDELSSYGVTPSDLPVRIANQFAIIEKKSKKK